MDYIQNTRRYKSHSLKIGYIYESSRALSVPHEISRDLSIFQDLALSFLAEENEIKGYCKKIIDTIPLEVSVRILREYADCGI